MRIRYSTPARGIMIGAAVSSLFWIGLAVAWFS